MKVTETVNSNKNKIERNDKRHIHTHTYIQNRKKWMEAISSYIPRENFSFHKYLHEYKVE